MIPPQQRRARALGPQFIHEAGRVRSRRGSGGRVRTSRQREEKMKGGVRWGGGGWEGKGKGKGNGKGNGNGEGAGKGKGTGKGKGQGKSKGRGKG